MADKFDILTNISDGALLRRSGSTLVSLTPAQLAALDALTAAFQAKNASLDALAADTVPAGLEAVLDGRYVLDSDVLDEDDFASNSATKPPSQQSVAEYVAATFTPLTAFVKPRVNLALPVWAGPRDDSNGALTLNTNYLIPVPVPWPVTVDQIAIRVAIAEASATPRLGLYAPAANGQPGDLIVDAGTVDASSTGIKTITLGTAVDLTQGLVYVSVTPQGASSTLRLSCYELDSYNPANYSSMATFQERYITAESTTRSGALPATCGATGAGTRRPPMFALRVSALL